MAVSLLISTLYGCKKVIDVSLKNATIQTVITGEITDSPGPYKVIISKTANFTADNNFSWVSGAFVTITGNGVIDTLSENVPGTYTTHILIGTPGESYALYVSAEGKEYSATSVMPQPVSLDSMSFLTGENKVIYAVANFQDPPDVTNYYQFIEYINGERLSNGRGNSVFDDRLSDGRYISRLLYDDSTDIKPGITITLQMNCVDQPVYIYLSELVQISGNAGGFSSPTPDNPTSNITGGALGYFSAHTVSSQSVDIP
ncbi:MAG: DUF4249 domain-containing protein [Ginsengibacter sp.]